MKTIHKYHMGIIGNCSYMAYIDISANIKWMSMPRFDSSFIFGSLLDETNGGDFYIQPASKNFSSKQYYIENTNILCTEFTSKDGRFRVIDSAPRFHQYDRYFKPLMVVRKIELLTGRPLIKIKCQPAGDYGKIKPEIILGSNHIRYMNIGGHIRLTTDIPLTFIINEKPFVLSENKYIVFSYGVPLEAPLEESCETFLEKTRQYWNQWIKSTSIPNIYQKEIIRSALVLKLHQYEDTGGIIASGSTSLPEFDQSGRNWDYRYCWMRDSYYTLMAFNSIGHFEELERYFQYIENIILNEKGRIQPLYKITGDKEIKEQIIDLPGYKGNLPVRIGNAAYLHNQNDVYGQLLISLLPVFTDLRLNIDERYRSKEIVELLLRKIAATMNEADAGIWEFRSHKQFHCYTYLFHWAGSKAAKKIAHIFNNSRLYKKAERLEIEAQGMIEKCFSPLKNAYTQAIGVDYLDASSLKLVSMNYLEGNFKKAELHIEAHRRELSDRNGLLHRYIHKDDFGFPKTAFLVCSFWYAEALACIGKIDEAAKYFESLLGYSNHLGIYSEHVDSYGGQWGNFPQSYSHVGLINAAFRIARKLDKPIFF